MKFRLLGAAMALFLIVSASLGADVLKLGHIADPQNPYAQGARKLAELAAEKSGGSLEIQVFPSSRLGNQRELIEGLISGTVDMTLTSTAVLGNFVPEMGAFDLPFIFRDVEHAYKAMDRICMELGRLGEARGLMTLGVMENGVRHMTNNRSPIRVPADMKGLKIRVMEQPVYIEMMKALGASPTPMPFGEIYAAMRKGAIDGQENPLAHIWSSRFFEVQKYVSLTAHAYSGEPVLISVRAWNGLNPDQQKALRAAVEESVVWQRDLCRRQESEFAANIAASGSSVINDDVDKNAFAAATRATWKIFADSINGGQAVIDRIVALK